MWSVSKWYVLGSWIWLKLMMKFSSFKFFYGWLKIVFLISENYQCNSNHINCVRIIDIEYVQLKVLIFKNNLILMSISEILFIIKVVISITDKNINDTVNHFQLINDIEIEFWKKLISVNLTIIEFTDSGEVFQVFIISEHNYRVNDVMNFKVSLFKYFDNNQ